MLIALFWSWLYKLCLTQKSDKDILSVVVRMASVELLKLGGIAKLTDLVFDLLPNEEDSENLHFKLFNGFSHDISNAHELPDFDKRYPSHPNNEPKTLQS